MCTDDTETEPYLTFAVREWNWGNNLQPIAVSRVREETALHVLRDVSQGTSLGTQNNNQSE